MIEFYGGYQVYSETGVDLTQLRENLKRSPTDMARRNAEGIRLLRALDAARDKGLQTMSEPEESSDVLDFETLVHQLRAKRVQFVLIGGLAMRLQGSAHITDDCDICYARTERNIAAVADAFASLRPYLRGAPPGPPFKLDAATIRAGLNFTLTTELGDVDLLGEVSGIGGYEQALEQSEDKTLFGTVIRVLTIDGLIAAKKAAARAKDQAQLLELAELKKLREPSKGDQA
jgi:hypothetical protein